MKTICSTLIPFYLLLFSTGCETTQLPDPYDVNVMLGENLRGASVQVDMIGIPEDQLDRYIRKSVTEYFEPGDALREGAVKTSINFRRDSSSSQSFPATDPIWSQWIEQRGADYLVILADLPGLNEDKPGNADSRRLILPLAKTKWEQKPEMITIQITGDAIQSDPAPLETY